VERTSERPAKTLMRCVPARPMRLWMVTKPPPLTSGEPTKGHSTKAATGNLAAPAQCRALCGSREAPPRSLSTHTGRAVAANAPEWPEMLANLKSLGKLYVEEGGGDGASMSTSRAAMSAAALEPLTMTSVEHLAKLQASEREG
jgi:hypothetical protein